MYMGFSEDMVPHNLVVYFIVSKFGTKTYLYIDLHRYNITSLLSTLSQEDHRDLFRVVKWGHTSVCRFFRILYKGKLWLSPPEAAEAVEQGFNFTAPQALILILVPPFFRRYCDPKMLPFGDSHLQPPRHGIHKPANKKICFMASVTLWGFCSL